MLSTYQYPNRYFKSRIYDNSCIDNHKFRIPWLNFLTAQTIPEETDVMECSKRIRTDSLASSSSSSTLSIEDYYVVLDAERPHSINQQLNFAQIIEDEHRIEYEQCVQSIIIKIPLKSYATECELDELIEPVEVTPLLIHSPKISDKCILLSNNNPTNIIKEAVHDHYPVIASQELISTRQEKLTFKRTFAFDHTCMEKFDRVKQEKINYIDTCTEQQSLTHSYYIDNNHSKSSTLLRLIKKRSRIINSEYYLSLDEIKINEPKLLQVKYSDGRPTLTNNNGLDSIENSQLLKTSISSRLSLSKNSITQELSYRKRILNRVQNFFKPNSNEQSKLSQNFFMKK